MDELSRVPYLAQCVVSLSGAATSEQFREMRELFERVRCTDDSPATVIWNQGPRVGALIERLRAEGLTPGEDGKGRANWIAFGYVLGTQRARVVATHDCDILDYRRDLLARLCYPTANPALAYEFAKGYYSRVSDRMHGRVTRLFMTPLIRSMKTVLGPVPLLEYLESFRYPLAGECSMTTELARVNRIPADWGLEVGVLAEVYRNCSPEARSVRSSSSRTTTTSTRSSPSTIPRAGLHRMVRDIAASLIRNLASYGVEFDSGFLNTMIAAYVRTAQDSIARYSDDAKLNGLAFDRHEEEVAVETFSGALRAAGLDFVRDPMGSPQIPNWNRVVSAMPDFLSDLRWRGRGRRAGSVLKSSVGSSDRAASTGTGRSGGRSAVCSRSPLWSAPSRGAGRPSSSTTGRSSSRWPMRCAQGRFADVLAHPQHPLYPALIAVLEPLSLAPETRGDRRLDRRGVCSRSRRSSGWRGLASGGRSRGSRRGSSRCIHGPSISLPM